MTNEPRQMVREMDQADTHERGLHCCVSHPDAGGRCERAATIKLYDVLHFCPEHGEEARIGALMSAYHDAAYFFDRFRNPHTPDLNTIVEDELEAAVDRMRSKGPSDEDYYRALRLAYPDAPERVRKMVRQWERDESGEGGVPPFDLLLDSLNTLHKMMRISHEDGEDWLTEILEHERQECAARAACAASLREARPVG